MDLRQLQKEWRNDGLKNGELQGRIWDAKAEEFAEKPLPDLQTDPFLKRVQEKVTLNRDVSVLDIGCGAGTYALALAGTVKEAVGTDVSAKMIDAARRRAEALSLTNTRFLVRNWASTDVEELGDGKRFSVVFAHMTPAVCDYPTLEKMLACAAEHCFLVKPVRRKDSVQDQAFSLVGITKQTEQMDEIVLNTFAVLWMKGYCPEISYRDTVWKNIRTAAETAQWCIERAKLQKQLTLEEEKKIRDYIDGISENETVTETVTTKIATIYWHM